MSIVKVGFLLAALVATSVVGKHITVAVYSQDRCAGNVTASNISLDTCYPIPYNRPGNYTAVKLGWPRDVPYATVYPNASANCTSLGVPEYVPCGRCAYSGRSDVGWYRYLCDFKRQTIRADLNCDSITCGSCGHHYDLKVGECAKYSNGTRTVQVGALSRMRGVPEIMYDDANMTCTAGQGVVAYDIVCEKCVGRTRYNCTVLGA